MAEEVALKWFSTVAVNGEVFIRLTPTKRAAIDGLICLTGKLSRLNRQAQREGLSSVEPECNQLLDEILRLLAVLSNPDPEDGQA